MNSILRSLVERFVGMTKGIKVINDRLRMVNFYGGNCVGDMETVLRV